MPRTRQLLGHSFWNAAMTESVIAQRRGRIGELLLDRPRALNALDLAMIRAIAAASISTSPAP